MFSTVLYHHQNRLWLEDHKVSFHGEEKLIYIHEGITTLDVQVDLYSDMKEWMNNGTTNPLGHDWAKYDVPIRTVAGDPTVSGGFLGDAYFMTNGWRVVIDLTKVAVTGVLFSDDYDSPWLDATTLTLVNSHVVSNLALKPGIDSSALNAVGSTVWQYAAASALANASTTIGYEIVSHLHELDFEGKVWVDTTNGFVGTTHPIGTRKKPSINITNALIIAAANSIREIQVIEDATIAATDVVSGYTITGSHVSKSEITIIPGAATVFTLLKDCSAKGTLAGEVVIKNAKVEDLLDFEGVMYNTIIDPGGIRLAAGSKPSHIIDCYSGKAGVATPEIDFNNVNVELMVRGYNGGMKLVNKNGAAACSIDLSSGQVRLNGTVVAGNDIVVRGVGKLVDDATDKIIPSGAWNGATIVNETHPSQYAHEIWQILGLDIDTPVSTTASSIHAGASVQMTLSGDPEVKIVTQRT